MVKMIDYMHEVDRIYADNLPATLHIAGIKVLIKKICAF